MAWQQLDHWTRPAMVRIVSGARQKRRNVSDVLMNLPTD
jgi:hypothetical protein